MQSTVIVDAEATFKRSDWIGVKKKYHNVYLLTDSEAYVVVVMYQKTMAKNGKHEPSLPC